MAVKKNKRPGGLPRKNGLPIQGPHVARPKKTKIKKKAPKQVEKRAREKKTKRD